MDKVAREVAEQEFDRFVEMMALDANIDKMDPDDAKQFGEQKERFVKAVMVGDLIVNDAGEPVITLGDRSVIFKEPTGATYIALGSKSGKKGNDVSALCAAMGDITGEAPAFFSRLPNRRFKLCLAVTLLFFGG